MMLALRSVPAEDASDQSENKKHFIIHINCIILALYRFSKQFENVLNFKYLSMLYNESSYKLRHALTNKNDWNRIY